MSETIALLEQSFELIKPQADAFVASFYNNMFAVYPAAKPMFSNTNMQEQKKKLLSTLAMVVNSLRQPDVLSPALKGLGARHIKYGVLPEHYPLVGNVLLLTFKQYLGEEWTPEVKQAWIDGYDAITKLMLEGANYDRKLVQLEVSNAV